MTQPPPNDDFGDLYTERELAEIDELNRMSDSQQSFLQSRWWKRLAIAFALVIALSLLLPILASLRGGGGDAPQPPPSGLAVPDFELQNAHGGTVRLSEEHAANSAVVIVFYRGWF